MQPPSSDQPSASNGSVEAVPGHSPVNGSVSPVTLPMLHGRPAPLLSAPPALAAIPSASTLLRALQRRWLLGLTTGLICGLIASAIAWFVLPPPKYTARSLIQVYSTPPRNLYMTAEA